MRCIAESVHPSVPPEGAVPGVSLRGFQLRDVPFISVIVTEALSEQYDPSLYVTLSEHWSEGFLIADDALGRPIGFLLGVTQVEGEGRVLMFAVDRDHRRAGTGSRLMETFLERARQRGLRRATLEVRVGNATAIRFYTRFGFAVVDLLRGYYSDGENGYQMARNLE